MLKSKERIFWRCTIINFLSSSRYNSINLFVGINGRALIMLHELVKRRELALPDAVHGALHVHSEVFVTTRSFQRHAEVAHLLHSNIRELKNILLTDFYTFGKLMVPVLTLEEHLFQKSIGVILLQYFFRFTLRLIRDDRQTISVI